MAMDRLATEDSMACLPSVESTGQCAATWQRNCGELWRGTGAQQLYDQQTVAAVREYSVAEVCPGESLMAVSGGGSRPPTLCHTGFTRTLTKFVRVPDYVEASLR